MKKSKKIKVSKKVRGAPRKCSACGKLGHNARSHLPGGLLGP